MSLTPQRPPWTNRYKHDWDDAYQRVMAWWEGTSLDRPVIISPLPKPDAPAFQRGRDLTWAQRDLDEAVHIEGARYHLENTLWLAEAAPAVATGYASLLWMLGAMAGAQVHYTPDTGTAWVEPTNDLYNQPLPEFDTACPPYAFTIHMIHRYAEEFGYDCILGANAMVDPLTTLAMMRGPEQFCLDLLDCPDMVQLWDDRLSELFMQIVSGWRSARAEHHRREEINWTGMWAPGDMDAVQCDVSALLSPEMFTRFALPELEKEAAFCDYVLWHLDGKEQICHLDLITSVPKVRGIQWADNPYTPALDYIDLFKRIRAKGLSVICYVHAPEEAIELTRQLGKDGLAIGVTGIKSQSALESLLAALKRL
ncbi:MAG: hypothetical protein ACYC6L_07765 [Anaerolineae bacterium]